MQVQRDLFCTMGVDLPREHESHWTRAEGDEKPKLWSNCHSPSTNSERSWSIVCIYLQTSLVFLIWKILKGYFNFQLFWVWFFTIVTCWASRLRCHLLLTQIFSIQVPFLRLISIQKCITIGKMCGQTVWTNRFWVQKFLLLIRTKWPPFAGADQSPQVNAALISTTAKRKTLKVNNCI